MYIHIHRERYTMVWGMGRIKLIKVVLNNKITIAILLFNIIFILSF